jgi:nicotinamide-nucleotide amidase
MGSVRTGITPSVNDVDQITNSRLAMIAERLRTRGLSLAVAESLTGGLLSSRFAAGPDAGDWYCGGIVAYTREVKQRLLGVGNGRLVSEHTALEMVRGVADLLSSDVAVAVTGAGGPDGLDGAEPGEVWVAVCHGRNEIARYFNFSGDPEEICKETCEVAIGLVPEVLELGRRLIVNPAPPRLCSSPAGFSRTGRKAPSA